jgi:signal transduction histidine kinase
MYLSEEANSRLPVQERQPDPRVALAEGVQWLWENRDHTHGGRSSLTMQSGSVTLLWRVSGTALAGFVAGSEYLENQWIAEMKRMAEARQVRLFLGDALGNTLGAGTSRPAIRPASVTQLPWTIQILNTGDDGGALRSRRNLLLAGMGVLLLLILTGGWFTGRTVARELAVARLQSDFVSAVSHEFRTPLTTLCQLSELLKRDRVASDEDRRQYYELLNNESHRLRRLVESLLNFGRLEAGKMHLRFEELDAAALVRELATEFAGGPQARGHRFEVLTPTDLPMVRADRETLRCVFWNLFENAAKYSPNCDTVWVELAQSDVQVEIKVRDQGVGIPRGEQRRIFEKFVRGTAARASDVRGTGIGLALARQIVRAHGGDITLESEPGQGSTFRVALPGKSS